MSRSRVCRYMLSMAAALLLSSAGSAAAAPAQSTDPAAAQVAAQADPLQRFADDLGISAAAFQRFNSEIGAGLDESAAAGEPGPLLGRLPGIRADLSTFSAATARMREYRLRRPGLERRRAAIAVAGPRLAAVVGGFLNAIESDDGPRLFRIVERLEPEFEAFDRALDGTPNVSRRRFLTDVGALNRVLGRIDSVVRRPTRASMRRGRAVLVRQRRAFDAVVERMRHYRLEDDELDARRATAVRRAATVRRRLSQAIARARSARAVRSGRSLGAAIRAYERQIR